MSVCPSVCPCGQCLENSSSHCPFPVECFGGWGKGEPGEARSWGASTGEEGGRAGKDRAGGRTGDRAGRGQHGRGMTGRGGARALSVWTKIGQCLEDSSSLCPFPVELVTNRAGAGQGGQGSRCGGEVPFLLKKSLGKTGVPASNQTKIQFF
jgi:hypothetical protein